MKKYFYILLVLLIIPTSYAIEYLNDTPSVGVSGTTATPTAEVCNLTPRYLCAYDKNFTSAAYGQGGGTSAYWYANYSIITYRNYTSAKFNEKMFSGNKVNRTIPVNCLQQSPLGVRVQSAGSSDSRTYSCRNGTKTAWVQFYTNSTGTGTGWVFELPVYFTYQNNITLNISFYDEISGVLLTTPYITSFVTTVGNVTTQHNTNTGFYTYSNPTVGNITISASANYNYNVRQKTYAVQPVTTVQQVGMYLSNSSTITTFTVNNANDGQPVSDVYATMYSYVGSTLQVIESKYTDITGRAQFYYTPNRRYSFTLFKTGFTPLSFTLNPVYFDSYTVLMSPSGINNYTSGQELVSIHYNPPYLVEKQTTTFNFSIVSPYSALVSYGYNLSYPGGASEKTGGNPAGELLQSLDTVLGSTPTDTVLFTYFYTTTYGNTHLVQLNLPIVNATQGTLLTSRNKTYGLGVVERIIISVVLALLVIGIATLTGKPIVGLILMLIVYGWLSYIGFIPIWAVMLALVIGVLYLVFGSGSDKND